MLFIENLRKTLSSFRPLHLLGIFLLFCLFSISVLIGIHRIYKMILVEVPSYGGSVSEGILGSPRFINPLLSASQSDIDLTRLIYSGLMKEDAEGTLVPDIALSYGISDDGLTYTFNIRPEAKFGDGTPLTADDVLYTITLAQDETLKSSKKIEWEGVKVTKVDDLTIVFRLKQPFAQFLKSTTLGILPKHLWKDVAIENISLSDYNISPVGSGPYKINKISKKGGVPDLYSLEASRSHEGNRAFIDTLNIRIYPSTEDLLKALRDGSITQVAALESSRASSLQDSSKLAIMTEPLPRVYGVFFNQNKNTGLVSKSVREALSMSVDRNQVITEAIYGYGVPAYSPIPKILRRSDEVEVAFSFDNAVSKLEADGFTKNQITGKREKKVGNQIIPLKLTITTVGNVPEFEKTAEVLKINWEKIGATVDIRYYDLSDLNQKIIKDRDYEVLLYGTVVKSDADLYAFWHSSQIKEPGLNLSGYTNTKVDNALEKIRGAKQSDDLSLSYDTLISEISSDNPAVFVYSPEFIYISNKKIYGINLSGVIAPEDRYKNIADWYINTEYIWKGLENIKIFKNLQTKLH